MKLPVSKLIYMKYNALLFPSASISGFEDLKLGSRWHVVVLALLKEESAFPWVTGNGGGRLGQTSSDCAVAGCCDCENVAEGW